MNLSEKTKINLTSGAFLIGIILILLLVGEIIVPFILAIFIAYLLNPFILKIKKWIKNRNLAVTSFLLICTLFFLGVLFFLGGHIVKDTNRLVSSVNIFVDKYDKEVNDTKENVSNFLYEIYESETIQSKITISDTISIEENKEDLLTSLESVYSFFLDNSETQVDKINQSDQKPWSWFYILIYTILYTVIILYTYDYFQETYTKYFDRNKPNRSDNIWQKFNEVFMKYFKQRTKVVLINIIIFIVSFSVINLPGAIVIGVISGLLTYASQFHYFSLPMTIVGCWVLSIEHDYSFFLFFGIVLLIYVLVSILEETLFLSKIMNSVNGMNSAVTILAFALSIHIFGSFVGTVVALPLTQLILILLDRHLLHLKKQSQ